MKKIFSVAALAVSAVLGVLYLLSLLWWTDPSTGFVTWGGTQTRYFAMLFPVLLAFCVGRATSAKVRFRNAWRSTKVLLPVSMASAVYGFMTIFSVLFGAQTPSRSHHLTATLALLGDLAELLLAVLFLLFSLWGILIFLGGHQGQTSASLYLGLADSVFLAYGVMLFNAACKPLPYPTCCGNPCGTCSIGVCKYLSEGILFARTAGECTWRMSKRTTCIFLLHLFGDTSGHLAICKWRRFLA